MTSNHVAIVAQIDKNPTSNDIETLSFDEGDENSLSSTSTVELLIPTLWPPILFDPGHPENVCNAKFDAVSYIRGEMFLFKGPWFWRVGPDKRILPHYPKQINKFWYSLPPDLDRIDAIYERPSDRLIVIFRGEKYWEFDGNVALRGSPHPISDFGFDEDVKKIDAVFIWGYNMKTYFVAGTKYWKFDEFNGLVDHDYPREMPKIWSGVPTPIDSAFLFNDRTYFLKNDEAWPFNDGKMSVEPSPSKLSQTWLSCENGQLSQDGQRNEHNGASALRKLKRSDGLLFGKIIFSTFSSFLFSKHFQKMAKF